jgi:hypothetical protein
VAGSSLSLSLSLSHIHTQISVGGEKLASRGPSTVADLSLAERSAPFRKDGAPRRLRKAIPRGNVRVSRGERRTPATAPAVGLPRKWPGLGPRKRAADATCACVRATRARRRQGGEARARATPESLRSIGNQLLTRIGLRRVSRTSRLPPEAGTGKLFPSTTSGP